MDFTSKYRISWVRVDDWVRRWQFFLNISFPGSRIAACKRETDCILHLDLGKK